MQREDQTDHGNGLGTNSSESAVNHLSKSVVRDTEGEEKQKPHATLCGNRGRATAPGDPVTNSVRFATAGSAMMSSWTSTKAKTGWSSTGLTPFKASPTSRSSSMATIP